MLPRLLVKRPFGTRAVFTPKLTFKKKSVKCLFKNSVKRKEGKKLDIFAANYLKMDFKDCFAFLDVTEAPSEETLQDQGGFYS
jgi:hypothetical protein